MRRSRRQRLGQHFLRDGRIAEAMAVALAQDPPRVLEIGPGRGALTTKLLSRFPQVRTVELDARLAENLRARLGEPQGLEVVLGDALQVDLAELAAQGPWQVAANLPYSVATAIVRRLLWHGEVFPLLVVMVQKEVAQRMLAPEGHRARGVLSVEVQLLADGELLFTVPPKSFAPPPRVMSAVLRLRPNPKGDTPLLRRAVTLARTAFTHRRKKLANALAGLGAKAAAALQASGVDGRLRPQDLSCRQWLALAQRWQEGS